MTDADLSAYYASLSDEEIAALGAQSRDGFTTGAWRVISQELARRGLRATAGAGSASAVESPTEHPALDPHIMRAVIACAAVDAWLLLTMVRESDQMAHTTAGVAVTVLVVAVLTFGLYTRSLGAAVALLLIVGADAVSLLRFDGSGVANYSAMDKWGQLAISAGLTYLLARATLAIARAQPFPPPPRE